MASWAQHQTSLGPSVKRSGAQAPSIGARFAVIAAGLLSVCFQSTAQSADAAMETESNQSLQEVVVTGSIIPRADAETQSPVQVITSKQLTQSGYTSVQQVLNDLAANGQ